MNSTLGNTQERSEDATPESLQQTLEGLKEGLKKSPSGEHLFLRIYRAISWIRCAQEAGELAKNHGEGEDDGAFIFYWIAFDCLFHSKQPPKRLHNATGWRSRESQKFSDFFNKILKYDEGYRIYDTMKDRFQDSILLILENPYIYKPFWMYDDPETNRLWEPYFLSRKSEVRDLLYNYERSGKKTGEIISTLFESLYVLRNQLMHGGATWRSSANRTQVKDGTEMLSFFLPIIVDLMMKSSPEDWEKPSYPLVKDVYRYKDMGDGVKIYDTNSPLRGDGDK